MNSYRKSVVLWLNSMVMTILIWAIVVNGQGTLSGRVINASKDSVGVRNAKVLLLTMKGHGQAPTVIDSIESDRRGHYSFRLLSVDSALTYIPTVDYRGVRYYGSAVDFKKIQHSPQSNVAVYDPTHSDEHLNTAMHHMFVEMTAEGAFVREVLILTNAGNQSIVGSTKDSLAHGATVVFSLPPGASSVEPMSGFAPGNFDIAHGRLLSFGVMVPGTNQVAYGYTLPNSNGVVAVHRVIDYDTNLFDLFIADPKVEVSAPGLLSMGPFNIRNTVYQRFAKENITAGERIVLTLRGGVSTTHRTTNPTPIIAVTAIILLGGLISTVRKKTERGSRSTSKKEVTAEKQQLLTTAAKLDDSYAEGEIGDQKYADDRARLMDRLVQIERELLLTQSKPRDKRKK